MATCATLALAVSGLAATAAAASATTRPAAGCATSTLSGASRVGRIAGIVHPTRISTGCLSPGAAAVAEPPYYSHAAPPLLNHGGPVMSTRTAGDEVVVTPIFWEPSGFALTSSYKSKITGYLQDLAADSGKLTNVFASTFQYSGSNGAINDKLKIGTPIDDTTALPADGCTLLAADTTNIYADGTGYSKCIDDAQVIAETKSLVAANSLPSDLGHLYVLLLPKHVESCFDPGSTSTSANFCTLNHEPSAAYCAYHSAATGTVYANMPFPAYTSGTGFSCTSESLGGGIQSPNGDKDADVEISPMSHEMAEAITDPLGNAWYDSAGNENGDDCAYIYGALSGAAGVHYNQTINGHRYLTQEEFSNQDYVPAVSGCIQGISAVKPGLSSLSKKKGPAHGGSHLTITGTGFPGATAVHFGGTTATFSVLDSTHIDATVPAGTGTVDVTVTTAAGTSPTSAADHYTYHAPAVAPKVTHVSPRSGSHAGGTKVTLTGTGFVAGTVVRFGKVRGLRVKVVSSTRITVHAPKHARGKVKVTVTTRGGTSRATRADRFTYT